MYCLTEKALPNDDSDFPLPGRGEESDSAYFGMPADEEPPSSTYDDDDDDEADDPKSKSRILVISAIVFAVMAAGIFSYYFLNQSEIDSQILDNAAFDTLEERMVKHYDVGRFGSDHAHAAVAVFIDGDQLDFAMPQFQVQSKYIHFENDNPYQIHKHATNVTLHMLFASLGIEIESDCMRLKFMADKSEEYCSDADRKLSMLINGKPVSNVNLYEISHDDRILISLGNAESVSEQLNVLESLEIHDVPKKNQSVSNRDMSV